MRIVIVRGIVAGGLVFVLSGGLLLHNGMC